MTKAQRARRAWVPASVVQRLIDDRVRTGSLIPVTLPRRVLGTLTIPKGAVGLTLQGHPQGTRVRARTGSALAVGQTTAGNAPPSVGSAYADCSGYGMENTVTPDSGTTAAADAGDFVFVQPKDGGGWLVETPTGGGTTRVIGGQLRKIESNNTTSYTLAEVISLENGNEQYTDNIAATWGYSVIQPSEVCEDITIKRITFEAPSTTGQVAYFGLCYGLTVEDCQFEGGLAQGAYFQRCTSVTVKRCRVVGCGTTSTGTGYGFEFNTTALTLVEDLFGENVRYVCTRNTATYKFTERRTRGFNVFAALSDLHGGVAIDYDGRAFSPLPGGENTAFGTNKIQVGNSTWTWSARDQYFYALDVVQVQLNGGGTHRFFDSSIINLQVNTIGGASGDVYPTISNCVMGASWISPITGTFGSATGYFTISNCTFNCGARPVMSWASASTHGIEISNCTVNTTGKLIEVTGAGQVDLSLTNVTIVGGTGTRAIVSGSNINVTNWTGVTVNGGTVTDVTGRDGI